MVRYPVKAPFSDYGGNDPKKRSKAGEKNRIATLLVDHINDVMKRSENDTQEFLFAWLARDFNLNEADVADVLGHIDGSHNAITVTKRSA